MAIRGGNGDVYAANCDLVTGNGYLNGVPGKFVWGWRKPTQLTKHDLNYFGMLARAACMQKRVLFFDAACLSYLSKQKTI